MSISSAHDSTMVPMIGIFVVVCIAAALASWRTLTLFHVSIRNREVLVVYGRIPVPLLTELREIAKRDKIERGEIRALKDRGEVRFECAGSFDSATEQRIRNVCGLYPIVKLRHARKIANPTLGQRLGIAWLAWRQR